MADDFTNVQNTWQAAGVNRPNVFTGGNKFVSPSTSGYGILVQSNGTISADETAQVNNTTCIFQGIESTSLSAIHQFHSCGFTCVPSFNRTNGTYASKTPLLINQAIVQVQFNGWRGDMYRVGGAITATATENWSNTNSGARLNFLTCADGSTNARSAFILRQDGTTEPQFGIRFGSAGLSVLSTYEEGTWTPGVRSTGATFTVNATETVGRYIRIGKIVHVEFAIELSAATTGTTTNIVWLQNLPYAAQLVGTKLNNRPVLAYEGFTIGSANGGVNAQLTTATEFSLTFVRDNTTMGTLNGGMFSGSGARISGAFTYQVA